MKHDTNNSYKSFLTEVDQEKLIKTIVDATPAKSNNTRKAPTCRKCKEPMKGHLKITCKATTPDVSGN